jgi:hypothetical protein
MASLFLCIHPNYIRSWSVTIKKQLKYSYGGLLGYDTMSYSHKLVTTFRRKFLHIYFHIEDGGLICLPKLCLHLRDKPMVSMGLLRLHSHRLFTEYPIKIPLSLCFHSRSLEKWPHTTTAVNLNFIMNLFFPYILKVYRPIQIQSNKQKLL